MFGCPPRGRSLIVTSHTALVTSWWVCCTASMFRLPDFITSIHWKTGLGRSGFRPAKVTDCPLVYCLCDIKVCVPQPQCSDVITSSHAFNERMSQRVRVSAPRTVTDCSPNGHDAITSSQNPSNVILSQVGKERPMSFYKKMKKTHGYFSGK